MGNTLKTEGGYRVPYINSRYVLPLVWAFVLFALLFFNADGVLNYFNFRGNQYSEGFWNVFKHQIPMVGFIIIAIILTFYAIKKQSSFIPVAGLLTNLYLMTELGITNWLRFIIWLVIGLLLYFVYGSKHSRLNEKQ
jgi:heme/copper-type cytochrome/quinol oxidase subunit 2